MYQELKKGWANKDTYKVGENGIVIRKSSQPLNNLLKKNLAPLLIQDTAEHDSMVSFAKRKDKFMGIGLLIVLMMAGLVSIATGNAFATPETSLKFAFTACIISLPTFTIFLLVFSAYLEKRKKDEISTLLRMLTKKQESLFLQFLTDFVKNMTILEELGLSRTTPKKIYNFTATSRLLEGSVFRGVINLEAVIEDNYDIAKLSIMLDLRGNYSDLTISSYSISKLGASEVA